MAYVVDNKSTVLGTNTPHGYSTPHRMPTIESENITDILTDLNRQLYPTGRAWNIQRNGVFYNLHKAINVSFIRLIEAANLTIDSTIPDNDNFTEDDVLLWEFRLGLFSNPLVSLDLRIDAIKRKMGFPSNVKARQNPLFIEAQLRLAGFDVYVHENRFFEGGEWVYKSPNEIVSLALQNLEHGGTTQHGGGAQHGFLSFDVIANQSNVNESYSVGANNLWATFFIGGENLGDVANIPESRLKEFKELVLKLKPAHTVAFTFINYV